MDVKIGIQQAPREITLEVDDTPDSISKLVADAVSSETILTLTDTKGRTVVVPGAKIAYVELGSPAIGTVGFRS